MKPLHVAPPVIALLIATVWLTQLRKSTAAVKQENAEMQERLTSKSSSRSASFSQRNRDDSGGKGMKTGARETMGDGLSENPSDDWMSTSKDWKRLILAGSNDFAKEFHMTSAWKRLEKLMPEMDGEELTKVYLELSTLSLNNSAEWWLERRIMEQLRDKNPEFAFSQYLNRIMDTGENLESTDYFSRWLERDPAGARNWYERQVAEGAFEKSLDGKSRVSVLYEWPLVLSLIDSDPNAAVQFLNAIPENARNFCRENAYSIPIEKSKKLLDLFRRTTIPKEEYVEVVRSNREFIDDFNNDYSGDAEKVKRTLDSLGITPEERTAMLVAHSKQFARLYGNNLDSFNYVEQGRELFDKNRKWIQTVDPSSADLVTGTGLSGLLEKLPSPSPSSYDFVENTILDYLDSGAGDMLLVPLLEGSANGSNTFPKDKARGLANRIKDEGLRSQLMQKLN